MNSLILPQSSVSVEPIFNINIKWKIYSIHEIDVRIEISITVECRIQKWGLTSIIEQFLMKQIRATYDKWLDFVHFGIQKYIEKQEIIENENIVNENNAQMMNNFDINECQIIQRHLHSNKNSEISVIGNNCHSNDSSLSNTGMLSLKNSPSLNVSTVINIGRNDHLLNVGITDDDKCGSNISRGLRKPNVSLFMKLIRIRQRICPSFFVHGNGGGGYSSLISSKNIETFVERECHCLERFLWFIILVCIFTIILLTIHHYK